MALYAISDLHLALSTDKPMDIFGSQWINHDEKIKKNWIDKITEEDTEYTEEMLFNKSLEVRHLFDKMNVIQLK